MDSWAGFMCGLTHKVTLIKHSLKLIRKENKMTETQLRILIWDVLCNVGKDLTKKEINDIQDTAVKMAINDCLIEGK